MPKAWAKRRKKILNCRALATDGGWGVQTVTFVLKLLCAFDGSRTPLKSSNQIRQILLLRPWSSDSRIIWQDKWTIHVIPKLRFIQFTPKQWIKNQFVEYATVIPVCLHCFFFFFLIFLPISEFSLLCYITTRNWSTSMQLQNGAEQLFRSITRSQPIKCD